MPRQMIESDIKRNYTISNDFEINYYFAKSLWRFLETTFKIVCFFFLCFLAAFSQITNYYGDQNRGTFQTKLLVLYVVKACYITKLDFFQKKTIRYLCFCHDQSTVKQRFTHGRVFFYLIDSFGLNIYSICTYLILLVRLESENG